MRGKKRVVYVSKVNKTLKDLNPGDDSSNVIGLREHPKIARKKAIWNLIADSYAGGQQYIDANHLMQYPREADDAYAARRKRSVFFNHVQPLADVLSGFMFAQNPERDIPKEMESFSKKTSKQKGLDSFMKSVSIHSLLHSVGVLVDSPNFDENEIRTKADKEQKGLQPYAVLYMPWQIRDYATDDQGDLLWVLLDNSYTEKSNPLIDPVEKTIYRLWTKDMWIDYEKIQTQNNQKKEWVKINEGTHEIGYVPFRFVNWRDKDEDLITESPFEDIAILDKQIYNSLSYLDEMLASGTFKMLFYPCMKPDDIPGELKHDGISGLKIIPFPAAGTKQPFFDGAKLEDISSFITAIEMYLKEIFRKLGMDKDDDKKYVQSGVAKSLEFQKCEMLISHGATNLEETEKFMFETAARWEGKKDILFTSKYQKKFQSEEIDVQLNRLYEAYSLPFKSLKRVIEKEIVAKALPNLEQKEKKQLEKDMEKEAKDIEKTETNTGQPNVDNLVEKENQTRNQ